jgi:predicted DNA-binding transcriptional regulator AlpA
MTSVIVPPDLAALANLPDDFLITVGQVALLYSCSTRHAWRAADGGLIPPPVRVGRLVRWRLGTIREHLRGGCRPVRTTGRP